MLCCLYDSLFDLISAHLGREETPVILGRLEMLRKKAVRSVRNPKYSGSCNVCKEEIELGSLYFSLKRTYPSKAKPGKTIWNTKRIHLGCFPAWTAYMIEYLQRYEEKRAKEHKQTGRPITEIAALSPEQKRIRLSLMKKRSALINSLYDPGMKKDRRVTVEAEVARLKAEIEVIAPYRPFVTGRRIQRATEHKDRLAVLEYYRTHARPNGCQCGLAPLCPVHPNH